MSTLIHLLRNYSCLVNYDISFDEKWSDYELLEHVVALDCSKQQLTSLPELKNCQQLYCYNNQLTSLPELKKCQTYSVIIIN